MEKSLEMQGKWMMMALFVRRSTRTLDFDVTSIHCTILYHIPFLFVVWLAFQP